MLLLEYKILVTHKKMIYKILYNCFYEVEIYKKDIGLMIYGLCMKK